ncbi:hypothetical protein CTB07_21505 [Salmonella enterica]|nr:hypothetical protein [Salmonella enterica]EKE9539207.1 patatin-like phospholipase family protein [Salmonella enterica]MBW4239474.1 patatin-like phospholipase family protein [Enterobacter roggenkampii]
MKKKSFGLECFAVFEGGGAKGIAFAGALSAAENHNIHFSGYGGASSGAIIALLACLGYRGIEIKNKLKEDKITKLLDKKYFFLMVWIKLMLSLSSHNKCWIERLHVKWIRSLLLMTLHKMVNFICFFNPASLIVYLLLFTITYIYKGVFPTKKLKGTLIKYAAEKIYPNENLTVSCSNVERLTFKELEELTGKKLKVVGTDILSGSFVEYSSDLSPNDYVFDAVAASGAYPLFFRPTQIKNRLVADGGLSCNMPTFVYGDNEFKKLPIFAFDLMPSSITPSPVKIGFWNYVKKLCMSAIDASNNIITNVSGGIVVPVKISEEFGTFDFNLNNDELDKIYEEGQNSVDNFLDKNKFILSIKGLSEKHEVAASMFGDLKYLLHFIMLDFIDYIPANIAVIMKVYTDFTANNTHISSFASFAKNTKNNTQHRTVSLNANDPCVVAWNEAEPTGIEIGQDTQIFIPIFAGNPLDRSNDFKEKKIFALLSIELQCHYSNIPLYSPNNKNTGSIADVDFTQNAYTIFDVYSLMIRNAMLGQQVMFHDSKQHA